MTDSKFRVIVVGGGPVGLMAAHILTKAGIDFVVLEKYRTVTPEPGSSIGLWPPTVRVLDQLGLFDAFVPLMNINYRRIVLTYAGDVFYRNNIFERAKEK